VLVHDLDVDLEIDVHQSWAELISVEIDGVKIQPTVYGQPLSDPLHDVIWRRCSADLEVGRFQDYIDANRPVRRAS